MPHVDCDGDALDDVVCVSSDGRLNGLLSSKECGDVFQPIEECAATNCVGSGVRNIANLATCESDLQAHKTQSLCTETIDGIFNYSVQIEEHAMWEFDTSAVVSEIRLYQEPGHVQPDIEIYIANENNDRLELLKFGGFEEVTIIPVCFFFPVNLSTWANPLVSGIKLFRYHLKDTKRQVSGIEFLWYHLEI